MPEQPSAPLNFFYSIELSELDALVAKIVKEIEESETRNKRSQETHIKFNNSVRLIITNLFYIWHNCPDCLLGIPLNNNDIQPNKRYNSSLISVNTYKDAYNGLTANKYIEVIQKPIIGDANKKGRRTRVAATIKLNELFNQAFDRSGLYIFAKPNEEIIRLKDESKKLVNYQDNSFTNEARNNLNTINHVLQSHWYDLWMTDDEFNQLGRRLLNKKFTEVELDSDDEDSNKYIDFAKRSVYRVFNNRSFEEGGRFYGGWWQQIPSETRKYITIDTKQTVELDYSNLHPWMLYASKGIHKDLNEYDAYQVSDKIPRKSAKLAFNMLLNANKRPKRPPDFNEEEVGITWKEVLDTVLEFHSDIKEYMNSGIGVKLQYQDSKIAERVMLHFTKMNYPCLPMHDSFIIHHHLKDELKEVMLYEFNQEFGSLINIDSKPELQFYEGIISEPNITHTEIIFDNEYNGYEDRWMLWQDYLADTTNADKI